MKVDAGSTAEFQRNLNIQGHSISKPGLLKFFFIKKSEHQIVENLKRKPQTCKLGAILEELIKEIHLKDIFFCEGNRRKGRPHCLSFSVPLSPS